MNMFPGAASGSGATSYIPRHVCRLCLWQTFPLTSIWSSSIAELKIPEKINTIFPFNVDRSDGLPSDICNHCTYKLDVFYEFYQHVLVSHVKLKFCHRKDTEAHTPVLEVEKQEIIEEQSPEPSSSDPLDSVMPSAEYTGNFGGSNDDTGNHEQLPPQDTESPLLEGEIAWEDNQNITPACSDGQPPVDLPTPGTSCEKPASTTAHSAADGLVMTRSSEGKKAKLLKCSHCRNEFKTKVEIALHFCDSPSNTPKRLTCRYCYKQFPDGAALALHKKKHINQYTQTCGKCGKLFKTSRAFRSHFSICGSRSRDDLSRPRTPQTPNHTCDICNRQFYSIGGMKIHFSSREHRANTIKLGMKQKSLRNEKEAKSETDQRWVPIVTDNENELIDCSEAEGSDVFENEFSSCNESVLTGGNTKTSNMDGHEESKDKNQCLRRRTYSDSLWLVN